MRDPHHRIRLAVGTGLLSWLPGCATFDAANAVPTPPADARPHYRAATRVEAAPAVGRGELTPVEPIFPASYTAPPPPPNSPKLDVPPGIPGAEVAPVKLPPDTPETRTERNKTITALFPPLDRVGPDPMVDETPGCRAVPLDDLLARAKAHNPVIAQAVADVEDYRGRWVQAGLYPNPTMGYQADQVANLGTAGQEGGFFNQTIVVNGRLKLARAVAYYDYLNAQARLKQAEVDLARRVRDDYFAALVAAEGVRINRLVSEFTGDVYRLQVANVRAGQAAAFEASALRAVVVQSRTSLVAARNRYVSAWKQLAATLNDPDLLPAPLAGRIDTAAPAYRYESLKARLLAVHTDLAVAANQAAQAERSLVLERRRPIPDLENNLYFQNDTQGNSFQLGIQMGVRVPVFNRNQGAILSAAAQVTRQSREWERVRNDLVRQLADAYGRYETSREQFAMYRYDILPDLVLAFRGVYERYQVEPEKVNYNDIVTAQQNLATQLGNYLTALNQQWQAVSDLAGIVQASTLEELQADPNPAMPDSWPDTWPGTPSEERGK